MAEPSNETCQFDAGQPVSNPYKFAAEIAWLQEAARYFSNRPTGGEDAVHWANVYNAENANKIASRLDALSSRPAPMEAVAWREKVAAIIQRTINADRDEFCSAQSADEAARALQALAVIPTEGLGSSLRDTHRAEDRAVVAEKESGQ